MRSVIGIVAVALLVACDLGCGEKEKSNEDETGPLETTVDYVTGQTAIDAKSRAHQTVFETSVKSAINLFEVEEGRSPTSLKELVDAGYLRESGLKDEYGRPLEEETQDGKIVVRSVRVDGESGERIVNWEMTF